MILTGVRVLELTIAWAGPLAGRWLADLGAEVIKIEHPTARGVGMNLDRGVQEDLSAWKWGRLPGPTFRSGIFPDADPGERPWNRQGVFNKMQRNKLSFCIDLKAPGAREVLIDLVKVSDVVLDNYSPRGIEHLGLDYESLRPHNPGLIRASMSGYGHTGPAQAHPSWGPILEAQSGMASTTGYPDGGPLKIGAALPDPTGGLHGVVAILAALDERDRTGRGGFIDLSQLETYAAIGGEKYLAASATSEPPARLGNRSADRAPQGVYRCHGDEAWIAISVASDEEWKALAGLLSADLLAAGRSGGDLASVDLTGVDPTGVDLTGVDLTGVDLTGVDLTGVDLASVEARQRFHDDIDAAIETWTRDRDRFDAMRILQEHGVRASALLTNQDLVENEHLASRGFIAEWDQVDVGRRRFPGFPVHFADMDIPMRGAPGLGADNERVIIDILGYPPERLADLQERRVIATTPGPE